MISSTVLPRLACCAFCSRKVSASAAVPDAPQGVDPAAGVLDGEGFGVVDAKPAGALLAGRPDR